MLPLFHYKLLGKCNVSFNRGRAINAVFFLAKNTLDNLKLKYLILTFPLQGYAKHKPFEPHAHFQVSILPPFFKQMIQMISESPLETLEQTIMFWSNWRAAVCDNGTLWVLGGDFCQSLHSTFACGNVSLLETILCTDLNNIQSLLESISSVLFLLLTISQF